MVDDGAYLFLPSPVADGEPGTDITVPLPGAPSGVPVRLELGERVLWRGHTGLSEHLYSDAMDRHAVRWTLPAGADVVVTDRRIAYAGAGGPGSLYLASADRHPSRAVGHVRWHWPYHLYVCPGGSPEQPSRLLLVCGAAQAPGKPALVMAGGDLAGLPAVDALANTIRRAVATFRLDRAGQIGITPIHAQALSRRLVGPTFANRLGGPQQAVNLPGALLYGFRTANEYRLAAAMTVAGLRAS